MPVESTWSWSGRMPSKGNTDIPPLDEAPPKLTIRDYVEALAEFDAAVCEALAVGQAGGPREAVPYFGYGTHIFTRLCAHAIGIIRAAPRSRWVQSDSEFWDFSAIAGHVRALIEGRMLFAYIVDIPENFDEWGAKLDVMNLYDCCRRQRLFAGLGHKDQRDGFKEQAAEIRSRLTNNPWFTKLDDKLQKKLLEGNDLTIWTRNEQLEHVGIEPKYFYWMWDTLSQHTHVLTFSFYRLEANGRGTSIMNEVDLGYLTMFLQVATSMLTPCIDKMVEMFPDKVDARKGLDSKFSPGPRRNLPRHKKRGI
ncbi:MULTISPECIES: hypothetical protein [unclassified Mesorhizobium]|uniref:hypothetical protein n=1 Tax=unclassified Mesorhizobium TaxID=325217 RepID=UPI001129FDD5|nr:MULTISPECIES: hypothetical protein [unclassified Mesorhizobium]TPI56163.1 hypothetical protein FJW11_00500 [Mesorhizobium sp. B3-1-1]TPJ70513.1 hypothetical protein FJ462_07430 [Mesorhizobium sp. B2-6-7]TPJ89294.1 hypothetical protein FJ422_05380 [Mesorhizobium sp. B2-6-3]TPK04375.1 hypothetical protein FJ491_05380 [Mesorhizobium sp. B2-5-10]TPK14815.1 hypothetical protein FJ490_05775 [Mesorhizobium sp. B2-5-11]